MAHDTATPEQGAEPLPVHQPPTTNHHEETNSQGENSLNESRNDTLPGLEETVFHSDGVSGNDLSDDESYFANSGDEVNHETPNLDSGGPADRGSDRAGDSLPSGDGAELVELPAEPRKTAESAELTGDQMPHVAEQTTSKKVLPFATRGKTGKSVSSLDSTGATRGTKKLPHVADGRWQVDYVRASENTYAFRLRWAEGKKRGTPLYIKRVTATVFQSIRRGNYEAFKQQLIASHSESPLRASHAAG